MISEVFAEAYDFDEGNALLYRRNQLGEGMKRAIELTATDYNERMSALMDLAKDLRNQSLSNLKDKLATIGPGEIKKWD